MKYFKKLSFLNDIVEDILYLANSIKISVFR